eukprot:5527387-Pleurochrysis_carterae.AAC.3
MKQLIEGAHETVERGAQPVDIASKIAARARRHTDSDVDRVVFHVSDELAEVDASLDPGEGDGGARHGSRRTRAVVAEPHGQVREEEREVGHIDV